MNTISRNEESNAQWRTAVVLIGLIGFGVLIAALLQFKNANIASSEASSHPVIRYPNLDSAVSIVELLSSPDKYHGKRVLISGYLIVRFEGSAIYLSKDSADYGISRNAIWVELYTVNGDSAIETLNPSNFDAAYVTIEANFNRNFMGHMGLFQGALEAPSRMWKLRKTLAPERPFRRSSLLNSPTDH
jgi:hypothetical protein